MAILQIYQGNENLEPATIYAPLFGPRALQGCLPSLEGLVCMGFLDELCRKSHALTADKYPNENARGGHV